MKFLVIILTIASYLPLQGVLGCRMMAEAEKTESGCHQMATQEKDSTNSGRQLLRQHESASGCYICQSGICSGLAFFKEVHISTSNDVLADNQCQPKYHFLIPTDLFLQPVQERAPPIRKAAIPLLSYDWQAFYSVFII